jgi:hypothetical protein
VTWTPFRSYQGTYAQDFRVADSDLSRYELYIGEDELPNLRADPAKTSASLPFTLPITPPASGTKTVYAVLRERTEYGLVSLNEQPAVFVIDDNGDLQLGPLSAPQEVSCKPAATGYGLVLAKYNYAADDTPADDWEIYAKLNSDPVIGVDSPVSTIALSPRADGIAYLSESIGPYATGNDLHVLVAVKRDADSERSSTAADPLELDAAPQIDSELTQAFGGKVQEVR